MLNKVFRKKKIILSAAFIFFTCNMVWGQSIQDSIYWFVNSNGAAVQRKVDSLKKQGIDTSINFFSTVEGWPAYMDSAGTYKIQYLIWAYGSKTYFQKFVELDRKQYKNFTPVISLNETLQLFLKGNLNIIRDEMIYPFIYKSTDNQNRIIYSPLFSTHRKYSFIRVYTTETEVEKEIYDDGLKEESISLKNLNYEYNNSTKLKALYELILSTIGKIDWN